MSELNQNAITLLSSTALVDMKTNATQRILYTIPSGKTAIITHVCIKNPSASLAGGASYAFGNNPTTYNNWDSAITLISLTAATLCMILIPTTAGAQTTTICAAGTEFSMYATDGSDAVATATIDVFGYLY
jgi:hypothetical protein